ncbi:NADH-quinone oxidoreductase subunit B family protein [Geothrix sp. 21YS21S-2]|uniref:NADH-quinone oxidoreductase subunit B family protein n=1 Tax=Geothrix sp. 21YS21S-2 TaxID=3068893 RepID=UPI0027B8B662|nr:NADH-quinone oxidoreductase subunit NuoB [Geothrix sp. 21YS21S-2]
MGVLEPLVLRLVDRARRKSAWLFHFNAGACNGCDIELVACLTPRYDVEQLGIRLEGSPRHADILCVTGPVTRTTREALATIHAQIPDPKVVVAIGSCPASGNVFAGSPMIDGPLDRIVPVDLYIPGCPPRPGAVVQGIAEAIELLVARKEAV